MAPRDSHGRSPPWGGDPRRYLAGVGIILLGCLLFLIPLYAVWEDRPVLSWRLTTTVLENLLFGVLSGSLVVGGIRLVRSDRETERVTQISRLTMLSSLMVGLLICWAAVMQLVVMGTLEPVVLALDGFLIGTVTAFGFSVSSVRARVFEQEAEQHRTMNERLELLYRATCELESATSREEVFDVTERATVDVFESRGVRVVTDGEVVVESADSPAHGSPGAPVETIDIDSHGYIELLGGPFEHHEMVTVDLFASRLSSALDRIERERSIRDERDKLEFVNRTLRHDITGDLSLLRARLRMVNRNVTFEDDRHAEHLSVALDRVEAMDEFLRTMQTYLQSVAGEDHSLEAIAMGTVLEEHVDSVGEAYPDVEIRFAGAPEVTVMADDLLGRVFVNILKNAVRHNDSATSRIEIEGERLEDTVRVRIADDGPGIPEDRREAIFERGERGTESGGTGFGLYLVKDVVEGYGGAVRVRDNHPRGTVFEVDLPVAGDVG